MIRVSWPRKAGGAATDLSDVVVRIALPLGLVDVKVCAIDETWSGLKFVISEGAAQPDLMSCSVADPGRAMLW
jgi:hypothetical protein